MTRAELYALIWQRPVVQLAQQFGISNAGLRKLCKDFSIPLPPAGYWTQRAHGKADEPPPLPVLAPTLLRKVNVALRRMGKVPLQIGADQLDAFDLQLGPPKDAATGAAAADRHPLVAALAQELHRSAVDERGFVGCDARHLPKVTVSPDLIERAARLFGTLAAALEDAGYRWVEGDHGSGVGASGEFFSVTIYEPATRPPGPPPMGGTPRPSGRLCLSIADPRPFHWGPSNRVGIWYDLRGRPVESCVSLAVAEIAAATTVIKHARAREYDAARLRTEASEIHRLASERLELARRETEYLSGKAGEYAEWLRLRAFADHLAELGPQEDASPVGRMRRALQERVDALARSLGRDALNGEALQLGLFTDEPES